MNRRTSVSQNEIERIHAATLDVLAEQGIAVFCPEARDIFKKHGASIDDKIVRIPSSMVEKALKTVPPKFTLKARNQENTITIGMDQKIQYAPTVGVLFVIDSMGRRRPARPDDHENLIKLSQLSSLCALSCAGLIYPQEFQGPEGLMTQMYHALTLSDKPILGLSQDGEIAKRSIEMAALATGTDTGCYIMAIINSLSPLAWDEKMLRSLITYAQKGQPIVVTCCSMLGLSSPMGIAETVVCNNAEILAGVVLSQLVNAGTPVVYGNTSTSVDMRNMSCTLGSPEYAQISALSGQMASYYNMPFRSGGSLTDAKAVDAQAGVESALSLQAAEENGVHLMFHALGAMDSFLSVSYEKWLLDEETICRLERLNTPIAPLREDIAEIIGGIGSMGNYLYHETTAANFHDLLYVPPLSSRDHYDVWRQKQITLPQQAEKLIKSRLERYEKPYMEAGVKKALKKYVSS